MSTWNCPVCKRAFKKENQLHSCKSVLLEEHFVNKPEARKLFEYLLERVKEDIGEYQIVSLPCCIHLYGNYDFLAVLPKRDKLEIRFALKEKLESSRLKDSVPISLNAVKNCIDIKSKTEIDRELIDWLSKSYHLS